MTVYLASESGIQSRDADLEGAANGKSPIPGSLISFMIPDYGIAFRGWIDSPYSELVSMTAVTALRFIEKKLSSKGIDQVKLVSDDPAFYFSSIGQSAPLRVEDKLKNAIREYHTKYNIVYGLVDQSENPARHPTENLPCLPVDVTWPLSGSRNHKKH
ncbi:MAG: hypothetical protein IIB00_00260 [candidate division Zixibacteria bacterium]|nr:hypothetical protein [candidate division Zixibacteria bacterium]